MVQLSAESHDDVEQTSSNASGHTYGTLDIHGNARVVNGNINHYNYVSKFDLTAEEERQRTAILNWLSPLTFRRIHEDIREKAIPQDGGAEQRNQGDFSGKWLLDSGVFDQWQSREIQKLWYHGMPGAGKTVLASVVIDHIDRLRHTLPQAQNNGKLAYLYLTYKEPHSLQHLLGSVIRQIVQDDEHLPDKLLEVHQRAKNRGGEPPTIADLSVLLADLSQQCPVYVIIDGLDECPRETRNRLVELMQPQSFRDLKLNILITSRLLDEFENLAHGFERVHIRASDRDIDMFIDSQFSKNVYLRQFSNQDPTLQDEVKNTVRAKCDGMFLLATIHINLLASQRTLAKIRRCLRELPTDIDETYDLALKRVLEQDQESRKLALDTFTWVLHSSGKLSLLELQHALAVDLSMDRFDPENIPPEVMIRDACSGLIVITRDNVRFVHYTAQTYFASRANVVSIKSNALIAETCAAYLCTPVLEQPDDVEGQMSFADDLYEDSRASLTTIQLHTIYGDNGNDQDNEISKPMTRSTKVGQMRLNFDTKREKYPFVNFAARCLGQHLRELKGDEDHTRLIERLMVLLKSRAKRNFLCRLYWFMELYYAKPGQQIEDLQLYLDHHDGADVLPMRPTTESSHNDVDDGECTTVVSTKQAPALRRDITPLHLAAYLGWLPLVQTLLSQTDDINSIDSNGRTPVIVAVQQGFLGVVAVLLDSGAKVDLTRSIGQDLMLQAAQNGYHDVVQMLVSKMDKLETTPLAETSLKEPFWLWAYLTLMIEYFLRLVLRQAGQGRERVILAPGSAARTMESLNDTADRPSKRILDSTFRLLGAAARGEDHVIGQIVQDVALNAVRIQEQALKTALFLTVEFGHVRAAKVIIQTGIDIDEKDERGDGVIHRAALRNDVEMVKMLLRHKSAVDLTNRHGRTAWWLVMEESGRKDFQARRIVLDALIRAGADPNLSDSWGVSVLYGAAAGGHSEIVRYLLEVGINPSKQTSFGWAPLHWAAADGHLDVVRLLVNAKADLSPMSDTSKTPLDMARTHKENPNRDVVVKLLLNAGALSAKEVLAARATRNIDSQQVPLQTPRTVQRHTLARAQLTWTTSLLSWTTFCPQPRTASPLIAPHCLFERV